MHSIPIPHLCKRYPTTDERVREPKSSGQQNEFKDYYQRQRFWVDMYFTLDFSHLSSSRWTTQDQIWKITVVGNCLEADEGFFVSYNVLKFLRTIFLNPWLLIRATGRFGIGSIFLVGVHCDCWYCRYCWSLVELNVKSSWCFRFSCCCCLCQSR